MTVEAGGFVGLGSFGFYSYFFLFNVLAIHERTSRVSVRDGGGGLAPCLLKVGSILGPRHIVTSMP